MIDPVFNRDLTFRRRWKHVIFLLLGIPIIPMLRATVRFRAYGRSNIPRQGGAILVSNHVHNADPILVYAAFPRPIFWMGKVEIWRYPVVRWIAEQSGTFPIDRSRIDRKALRTAEEILEEGLIVGMFPEGTRSTTGTLSQPFAGASLVARLSNAPLIPCAVVGSSDLPFNGAKQMKRTRLWPKVTIVFGRPFTLAERDEAGDRFRLDDLTDAIMIEIARLLPEHMRGIYADRANESHPAVDRENVEFTYPGIVSRS